MSSLKKLASDTALYGISSILGRVLNYLLVILHTRVFVAGEFGVVTELYAYVAFFNVLYTYGMETAYFRFATRNKADSKVVFHTAFTSILCSSLILSALLAVLAYPIMDWLDYEGKEHIVYWLAALMAIDAITAIPFAKLRLDGRPILFVTAKLINIFLNIGLNLLFLLALPKIMAGTWLPGLRGLTEFMWVEGWSVEYVFLANLLANSALLVLLLPVWKQVRLRIEKLYWKPMLVYAYPLLLMGLAGATNEMLSRAMLKPLLPEGFYEGYDNEAALGIFGACYKLSIFMMLAIQAFRYASEPFFFSKAEEKNSTTMFATVMHYFIIVCCMILFAVTVNLPWIAPIFLKRDIYLEGLEVVPILLLAYLFFGVYVNLSIWFKLSDKTGYGTWFTGTGAALTVILNLLLIPIMGYIGAALATLIVYSYMAFICYYYGQKHYPIPYKLGPALVYIIFTTVVACLLLYFMPESDWMIITLGIGTTILYIAGVVLYEKKGLRANL
ncbi:polysaccharide biosynthesis C-terminal domain-containing protein [Cesiribacter sp. SM1]|uniref:oligosaccharide flippase family protein n=1 Tax=Cesiribacter sp. SM1 TaxID=2861196 RepID=UPI001CD33AB5|nr:polysaccharide biosynthesis C-terminal domain-containing protein [Cesiribacter sp. SM1]